MEDTKHWWDPKFHVWKNLLTRSSEAQEEGDGKQDCILLFASRFTN